MKKSLNRKNRFLDFRWDAHAILAEVRRKGTSLRRLSIDFGYKPAFLTSALQKPNSKAEEIISDFLGVPAHHLWPERYLANGQRRKPQPTKNYRPCARIAAPMSERNAA